MSQSRDAGIETAPSPYHEGEQALQTRTGMRDRVERIGRKVIRDFMPDEHRELFENLPMLIVGSLDAGARPWASILTGWPGFIASPDHRTLEIAASPPAGDPLGANLTPGIRVGLLGIELETRRRNRMNGRVIRAEGDGFAVRVEQSFGNCPKYIQARRPVFAGTAEAGPQARHEDPSLSARAAAMVASADTFFIASAAPDARGAMQVDVSHRGGRPGFVRLTEEDGRSVLTAPDFSGNFHFATLGNILLHPFAGLLFVDFASGDLLSLTGEASIIWDGPDLDAFAGAQRLLQVRVAGGVLIEGGVPYRWSAPEQEPHLAATGTWG